MMILSGRGLFSPHRPRGASGCSAHGQTQTRVMTSSLLSYFIVRGKEGMDCFCAQRGSSGLEAPALGL
jgi:hypothetical protein